MHKANLEKLGNIIGKQIYYLNISKINKYDINERNFQKFLKLKSIKDLLDKKLIVKVTVQNIDIESGLINIFNGHTANKVAFNDVTFSTNFNEIHNIIKSIIDGTAYLRLYDKDYLTSLSFSSLSNQNKSFPKRDRIKNTSDGYNINNPLFGDKF